MEEVQWIRDWLPAGHDLSTRAIEPGTHELAATAGATHRFALAVIQFTEGSADDGEDPHQEARSLAATAAALDSFVAQMTKYAGDPSEDDLDDWDDAPPEELRARDQLAQARTAAKALTARARERLDAAGLPIGRRDESEGADRDIQRANEEYRELVRWHETAMAVGHAAAINWLIDELHEEQDAPDPERKSAIVLAMWPHEDQLMRLHHRDLPPAAAEAVNESVARILECTWCIEEHRPVFVSEMAEPQWHDGRAQELCSEFPNVGPEAEAMYSWEENTPHEAIMAYRHRGSTHVKLAREPYAHPISMEVALEHCHSLEVEATEIRDADEPEGPHAQAIRGMLAIAAINRTLALLGYHDQSREPLDRAVKIALRHGSRTQAFELLNAIYDEQAQAVCNEAVAHGLEAPSSAPHRPRPRSVRPEPPAPATTRCAKWPACWTSPKSTSDALASRRPTPSPGSTPARSSRKPAAPTRQSTRRGGTASQRPPAGPPNTPACAASGSP